MSENRCTSAASGGTRFEDLATSSEAMRAIHETALQLARTTGPVLIRGEVGVGKERLARAVHAASDRSQAPFVVAECSTLGGGRIENELLGHAQAPLNTNLSRPQGLFRAAEGGSLFFDEVAELSAKAQSALFRVLHRGELAPLDGSSVCRPDVRILSATSSNLEADVAGERFRRDLYSLLNCSSLRLPPLRERLADLPGIVNGILRRQPHGPSPGLTPEAMDFLGSLPWPGNVRELENVLERSAALGGREALGPAQILVNRVDTIDSTERIRAVARLLARAAEFALPLRNIEALYIEEILERTGGNKARAARILGVNRATLYRR